MERTLMKEIAEHTQLMPHWGSLGIYDPGDVMILMTS